MESILEMQLGLASQLRCEVDLVDLRQSHGAILQEVLCRGKLLLNRNPKAFEALLKRMWYEREDDQRYSEKTIKERLKQWED